MENKSLFASIVLTLALVAAYVFYTDKISNLEIELQATTQEYNKKLTALQSTPTNKASTPSALESLNNQLIKTQSDLKLAQQKLTLASSKTSVLGNEMAQMNDARGKVDVLKNSLQSTQNKLAISTEKVHYLENIFETQNKDTIINNINRIKELKETSSGIAVTGLIVPAIGVATLVSYTTEEINNYCANIQNIMALENKVFGKMVSLDTQMQKNYHNQCEVSLKDKIKKSLKKLKIEQPKN